MLMNHKNFRYTQIPDKTNAMISLESSKTLFLGHFCPMGMFTKNFSSVTQLYMGP